MFLSASFFLFLSAAASSSRSVSAAEAIRRFSAATCLATSSSASSFTSGPRSVASSASSAATRASRASRAGPAMLAGRGAGGAIASSARTAAGMVQLVCLVPSWYQNTRPSAVLYSFHCEPCATARSASVISSAGFSRFAAAPFPATVPRHPEILEFVPRSPGCGGLNTVVESRSPMMGARG